MYLNLLFIYCLWLAYGQPVEEPPFTKPQNINIAVTVDVRTIPDSILLMKSVLTSAINPSIVRFYVVVCGSDNDDAKKQSQDVNEIVNNCFNEYKTAFTIHPFVLPPSSGFSQQMKAAPESSRSHWYSPTGADMARFFLPGLFPTTDRLLYLDNDIIVTCCLEDIYFTDLGSKNVVGVALDDLKWATVTQFRRQYNASHPLVIESIRRISNSESKSPVSEEEFWKALPRYPNDGVLLFDVKRYRDQLIFEQANAIAAANAREYVVGLGTQQFTTLTMYDRWTELTPRANLRHFPDMARGYLMWFYYNGFIHYAGQGKPRTVCASGTSPNIHRVHSYTPWATTVLLLKQQCTIVPKSLDLSDCTDHIPKAPLFSDFLAIARNITRVYTDSALIYLKFGPMNSELMSRNSISSATGGSTHSQASMSSDYFDQLESDVIRLTKWNVRQVQPASSSVSSRRVLRGKGKNKDRQLNPPVKANQSPSELITLDPYAHQICTTTHNSSTRFPAEAGKVASAAELTCQYTGQPSIVSYNCTKILQFLKERKHRHWDVMTIGVDYDAEDPDGKSSSLTALMQLDLVFMRPRVMLVKLYRGVAMEASCREHSLTFEQRTVTAVSHLRRNGYQVYTQNFAACTITPHKRVRIKGGSECVYIWASLTNYIELTTSFD